MPNDYELVRKARKKAVDEKPPVDRSIYTPNQIMEKSGSFSGMRGKEEIKKV